MKIFIVGMDECDTAAEVFNCAKEKDPNVVLDMISNFEMDKAVVFASYSCTRIF